MSDETRGTWRGLEFKALRLALKDGVDESGYFEGWASTYGGNPDKVGDVVVPGAFAKTVRESPKVPVLFMHDPLQPVGVAELEEVTQGQKTGLRFKGRLELEVQRARETRALMRAGAMRQMSIGYKAVQKTWEGNVRHLTEIAVKEVSPVTTGFAANPRATIEAVKTARLADLADALASSGDEGLADAIAEAKAGQLTEHGANRLRAAVALLEGLLIEPGKAADDGDLAAAINESICWAEARKLAHAIRSQR